MKPIEEVRKICGHYYFQEKKMRLLSSHRCHHKHTGSCPESFKDCPLFELVKRNGTNGK